jgi:uncharacterized membrane protein
VRILAVAASALVAAAGLAYPFLIYFYGDRVPPVVFVAGALVLIGLQLTVLRSPLARLWRAPLLLSAVLTILVALLDQRLAREAYPAVRSLSVAAVFAWSLMSPPSLIERFARLRHPALPDAARSYCRNVTLLWAGWLVLNAAIAAALAVRGDVGSWAIWTGGVSYAISGLLFVGEFGYRMLVLEKQARP